MLRNSFKQFRLIKNGSGAGIFPPENTTTKGLGLKMKNPWR
jgi:hypothetical protein